MSDSPYHGLARRGFSREQAARIARSLTMSTRTDKQAALEAAKAETYEVVEPPERPTLKAYVAERLKAEFGDVETGLNDVRWSIEGAIRRLEKMVEEGLAHHPQRDTSVRRMFDNLRAALIAVQDSELELKTRKTPRRRFYENEYDMTDWESKGYS